MNLKQLNLDLVIGLMNLQPENTTLSKVKDMVLSTKEVGKFISTALVSKREIGQGWMNQTYKLKFENCEVNVDLVANRHANSSFVNGFQLQK